MPESIGGHSKGNPTLSISELKENWVINAQILYVGKAGGTNTNATLNSRLRQYIQFGKGKKIAHWGGRLIWQLKDSDELLVAWKILKSEEPIDIESQMINEFRECYGNRPFANLNK